MSDTWQTGRRTLEIAPGSSGGTGGAQNLATNIRDAEAGVRNSIVVSAGDLIGASPLISALFHDEPTIDAMNLIGLDINGVGNHEFDEGPVELLRMQNGGGHPDRDLDGDGFGGADFEFLAANVAVDETGDTVFDPTPSSSTRVSGSPSSEWPSREHRPSSRRRAWQVSLSWMKWRQ